ncbi:alpha/beta hydrolase [Ralstonia solanacearum]|uniref:Putative hydrolase (Alpha/beta superfamily domain) n=1 Tax=Ralstonia solanacearum (strain Po82) TaxID=1031711 RepID=F6G7V2_RALS8|nr:alpha/beta fold hydrolase [Ralstonia solanacearum]AEG71231.1 putative hydrolase (alpha/beta superfamily domain) [Ralstonia solanacearum Po82]AYB62633.1 GntR family transcriptional regulator [Ralstonia solanacearum]MCG3577476.1 prolyl oligopeptidase family serine peptidase [Ralstonia solanacearum]MCL9826478.1 prolyl oligopeptidase family serine peptidase [Ralstonia solanacearum]MCL9831278.1 prolyl oligopeptidase family serine peptidase [Ralstonia solanacearum]
MTGSILLMGPAGRIECLIDRPAGAPLGVAVVAHPHPLQGGSAAHKVPHQIAKALTACGYVVVRPNFRGVGRSEGVHDLGQGETEDLVHVIRHWRQADSGKLLLAGFSFGAYVMARAVAVLADAGVEPAGVVLAGTPWGSVEGQRLYETPAVPAGTLVVHGEQDERVPLSAVFAWARPQGLPVAVVPGANHFFTGKLGVLARLVTDYAVSRSAGDARQG